MTKKHENMIITALSVAAIALALLLSGRLWLRLDLTASGLYTISPASRGIADSLEGQVKISYFLSDKLRRLYPQPEEIIDLVREYVTYSNGKIRFTVRDPAREGLEADLQQLGIYPRQMQSVERNEATVSNVFSGILIEYVEKTDVIPFVFSLETLEYDLTSRIRALVSGKTREAGIILADSDKSFDRNYRNLTGMLQSSGYKVRDIPPGDEIPPGLSEVILIGGVETLDETALSVIDGYIRGGGKVFFLVENFMFSTATGRMEAIPLNDGGLLAMLRSYGADVRSELVLDESCLTITYQSAAPGGMPAIRLVRYPFWISVTREGGNPDHPVTSSFAGLDLFWASPLALDPPDGLEAAPLLSSTPDAWLMTRDFAVEPDQAFLFTQEKDETSGEKVLAAALSGRFPPYFKAGDGADQGGAESRIIVIGNSEFVNDEYLNSERNLTFFLLAADWLANDDDIIGIRSRAAGTPRLDRIRDPDKESAAMAFARSLNIVVIPAAVLAFAIVCGLKRRKKTA
ncbi:MAG: GldG family protein [Spirochaetaceae bacterium]|jgi:ABC-type uncharacterized transport system involved in gliding motility auxiliary subunit|nr:GldG family protein [Spirochaetaceae bacterium]